MLKGKELRVVKYLLGGCLTAALCAVIVTLLPSLSAGTPASRAAMVIQPDRVTRIGSDNLVDALIAQHFSQRIRRTDLKSAVLSVDFVIRHEAADIEPVYEDVLKLIRLSFKQARNVERLLIRFVDTGGDSGQRTPGSERLLLAADIRRTDSWLADDGAVAAADLLADESWTRRLRISFTAQGAERFGRSRGL
ncbi:hypothetical protein DNH61_23185 [Paenibacillus sambharensis]|uniref:Uncharacterized protein n=1 Tax=Paenibacillus sambharensis TaxID=1803190 RepID=A0A2W1L2D8_9BACL|nr:hypothetical protein [Paenibacillus sambharensis]PZD93526.1 hypothetical protein DNH61_23185 [Paenibacillus sambharensis]